MADAFLAARFRECQGVRGVKWNREHDSQAIRDRIKGLARLLAALRGVVSVWRGDGDGEDLTFTPPNVEAPYRAAAVLYNLARGRALLWGRQHLLPEDLDLVTHVALSSAPHERTRLIRAAVEHGGKLTTGQSATALRASPPTARKAMKALGLLGLADLHGETDHATGGLLTLRPEWLTTLGLAPATDTGQDSFQPPGSRTGGVESEMPLCVPVTSDGDGGEEVDPWAS